MPATLIVDSRDRSEDLRAALLFFAVLIPLATTSLLGAAEEFRIPGYSSYIELKNGMLICGGEYSSYHESRTGQVCAGGRYQTSR